MGREMYPRYMGDKWYIEVDAEELGKVLLLDSKHSIPVPVNFESEEAALEYIHLIKIKRATIDKEKMTKWMNEEIYGCHQRKETEREWAMRELLLKIERGYFDVDDQTLTTNQLGLLDAFAAYKSMQKLDSHQD